MLRASGGPSKDRRCEREQITKPRLLFGRVNFDQIEQLQGQLVFDREQQAKAAGEFEKGDEEPSEPSFLQDWPTRNGQQQSDGDQNARQTPLEDSMAIMRDKLRNRISPTLVIFIIFNGR